MVHRITLVNEPKIIPLASMQLCDGALGEMYAWITKTHPECYPGGIMGMGTYKSALFPHGGQEVSGPDLSVERSLTDNELLVELMGRLCYYSFGDKAGTPTNKAYIANTQKQPLPHSSLMYHPKMSFFISGISRRLTHELIRHYVGADRSEEGSPSQESTRYVEHPGWFVVHPYFLNKEDEIMHFEICMQRSYDAYRNFIVIQEEKYSSEHDGKPPRNMARKRIYEAASSFLPHSAMTSIGWTTNPAALAKLFRERTDEAADLEFQRLAVKWQGMCKELWPNLFVESR